MTTAEKQTWDFSPSPEQRMVAARRLYAAILADLRMQAYVGGGDVEGTVNKLAKAFDATPEQREEIMADVDFAMSPWAGQ